MKKDTTTIFVVVNYDGISKIMADNRSTADDVFNWVYGIKFHFLTYIKI
jgi:hypothetical protein